MHCFPYNLRKLLSTLCVAYFLNGEHSPDSHFPGSPPWSHCALQTSRALRDGAGFCLRTEKVRLDYRIRRGLSAPLGWLSLAAFSSWPGQSSCHPGQPFTLHPLPTALTHPEPLWSSCPGDLQNPVWRTDRGPIHLLCRKDSLLVYTSAPLLALNLYFERDLFMSLPKLRTTVFQREFFHLSKAQCLSCSQLEKPSTSRTHRHTGSGHHTFCLVYVSGFWSLPFQR